MWVRQVDLHGLFGEKTHYCPDFKCSLILPYCLTFLILSITKSISQIFQFPTSMAHSWCLALLNLLIMKSITVKFLSCPSSNSLHPFPHAPAHPGLPCDHRLQPPVVTSTTPPTPTPRARRCARTRSLSSQSGYASSPQLKAMALAALWGPTSFSFPANGLFSSA